MTYWQMRLALLRHPISAALAAVNQSGLFVVAIMGTALPAVFFLILLNFGILLDATQPSPSRLPILLHLILLQLLLIGLMRDAILGSKARLLLISVPGHQADHKVSMLLATLVNPLLWPPLFILLSTSPTNWPLMGAQWLLPVLLLGIQWSGLFAPAPSLVYLSLIFLLSLLPLSQPMATWLLSEQGMITLLLMLLLCQKLPIRTLFNRLQRLLSHLPLPVSSYIAQSVIRQELHGLVLRLTLALMIVAAGHLVQTQVAQFSGEVQTLTVSLLAVIAASWQLPLNRFLSAKREFLLSLPQSKICRATLLGQPLLLGLLLFQFWLHHGEHCWLQIGLLIMQISLIQIVTIRAERQFVLASLISTCAAMVLFVTLAN
ncbi:DUF6136 family protein [Shewanella sp.]|uniref:DUF6136 family protein n=1 Tax=Shewanella sp. TaxID=50422 RepID=UPI003562B6F4